MLRITTACRGYSGRQLFYNNSGQPSGRHALYDLHLQTGVMACHNAVQDIRRSEENQTVRKPAPFNGVGEITVRSLLNGPEEMSQKGRVFGHTTVYPGSGIDYHIHTNDSETYYILSGKGLYNDNGTEVEIGAGDVTYCAPGEGHGLKCLGNEPVEMIALILYE